MFLLSQNDENQSENGSKNSKIRLRARPPAEPQKKMLQTKKLRSKSWKTRVFFTFRLPILDGRVHEQVSSVLFFTVFFEGERHDLSKTGCFGRKMPPPPGKPVTFYECHPEDHAPAPSVRADFCNGIPKQGEGNYKVVIGASLTGTIHCRQCTHQQSGKIGQHSWARQSCDPYR